MWHVEQQRGDGGRAGGGERERYGGLFCRDSHTRLCYWVIAITKWQAVPKTNEVWLYYR